MKLSRGLRSNFVNNSMCYYVYYSVKLCNLFNEIPWKYSMKSYDEITICTDFLKCTNSWGPLCQSQECFPSSVLSYFPNNAHQILAAILHNQSW